MRTPLTIALCFLAFEGFAFQPLTASNSGAYVHWHVPVIGMELDYERAPVSVTALSLLTLESADKWADTPCRPPALIVTGGVKDRSFGVDGFNRLLWVDIGWPGTPAEMGLTLVTRDKDTGEIVDADILMNSQSFSFTAASESSETVISIPEVLTHELGHLYGLDHSEDENSLMYGTVNGGQFKDSPTGDDLGGICTLYRKLPVDAGRDSRGLMVPLMNNRESAPVTLLWVSLFFGLTILFLRQGKKNGARELCLISLFALSCQGELAVVPDNTTGFARDTSAEDAEVIDGIIHVGSSAETEAHGGEDVLEDSEVAVKWEIMDPDQLEGHLFVVEAWEYNQELIEDTPGEGLVQIVPELPSVGYHFGSEGQLTIVENPMEETIDCGTSGQWGRTGEDEFTLSTPNPFGCEDLERFEERFRLMRSSDDRIKFVFMGANWSWAPSPAGQRPYEMTGILTEESRDNPCSPDGLVPCETTCEEEGRFRVNCEDKSWDIHCNLRNGTWNCPGMCADVVCKEDDWGACTGEDSSAGLCTF